MTEKFNASDFYCDRQGPWPQPSPTHPWGESPSVLHLPLREKFDWWTFVGSRYLATLGLTPYYFLKGLFQPGLKEVSDSRFEWFLNETMLSKFLTDKLDDIDKNIFKEVLKDTKKNWYIVDLEAVKVVNTFKGLHCSGSKTLLYKIDSHPNHEGGERYIVHSIYIDKTNIIFYPKDGEAWELAKYFVLQGGALCSTLVTHPIQHFPNDSINAIVKTALPKNHLLYRLLYPHLRFTLQLENAVLNYKSSLLQEKWWMVYAPYPGGPDGLRELLVEGFKGIKGNASYPPFSFPMKEPNFETKYGIYLRTYYKVISNFVGKIIKYIPEDEIWTKRWANYVNKNVKDFPNGDAIFKNDNLHKAVTSFLFTITVGHSVDHYNYGALDKREIPLRLRQAPPTKETKLKKRSKLCNPIDLMKYYLADSLFFSPSTVTSLIDTEYNFLEKGQRKAVQEFKEDLINAEKELLKKGIKYMPLKEIAASVQF
ncbi:MAG: hypothetical protein HN576_14320 [Bacteriovoracaceae bacterium]|jgi:hypothetical protein|nr:hypothetical protein [Bacteriovoracaceae bacterium]